MREWSAKFALNGVLVLNNEGLPIFCSEVGVEVVAVLVLVVIEDVLEGVMLHVEHDVRIHLDETAIAVIGKAPVAEASRKALDSLVIESEV